MANPHMTLDALILLRRIRSGDEAALAALYAAYGRLVYSLALQILRSPMLAQEATQDTFLKIWRNPQAYDETKGQFSSWLLTLARYTAIDRLRREVRHGDSFTPLDENIPHEVDEPLFSEHDVSHLHTMLALLPNEQRVCVELAYFHGLTHSQIAEKLAQPLGTVKTRLRLGLQKLKELMNKS